MGGYEGEAVVVCVAGIMGGRAKGNGGPLWPVCESIARVPVEGKCALES